MKRVKTKITDVLAQIEGDDINRLALLVANQIAEDYRPFTHHVSDTRFDFFDSETMVLALFIQHVLWEIKEHGQIKTHPEDLLHRVACNFRDYEYRNYPIKFTWLCRAFVKQIADAENLSCFERRGFDFSGACWNMYGANSAATSDYSGRRFVVKQIYSHDEFDNKKDFLGWYVCEELHGLAEYEITPGKIDREWIDKLYAVVPFSNRKEAEFFLVQLVDLLNTGKGLDDCDDYICQAAAQLVRDTLAQAPVEETLMREEAEAKARAEQLEKERIQRERNERKAQKLAARKERERQAVERIRSDPRMNGGDHVYIIEFEPLSASKDFIKIGHSVDVFKRMPDVNGGVDVLRSCCTAAMTIKQTNKIENQCHEHFAGRRKIGSNMGKTEYFYVPYDEACAYLRSLVDTDLITLTD